MFEAKVYTSRREMLRKKVKNGLILLPGNPEVSYNYPANTYHFRQDSNFLYFFGLDHPDLAGVMDVDSGKDYIFGNDVDLDDIIWMGPQPALKDRASLAGVANTAPLADLVKEREALRKAAKDSGDDPKAGSADDLARLDQRAERLAKVIEARQNRAAEKE